MSGSDVNVLHVIGTDTPTVRLEALRALCGHAELGRQHVVQVGGNSADWTSLGAVEHLPAPFGVEWLAWRNLRNLIRRARPAILHLWSSTALRWVSRALARAERVGGSGEYSACRLIMDVEVPLDFGRLAHVLSQLPPDSDLRFICPTVEVRRHVLGLGVPPENCVLIRDSVDFTAIESARRSDLRSRLDCSAEDPVVLLLPPVRRETGALVAAWSAMLVRQVRPNVRFIVPETGREVRRVVRLVQSCRQQRMLRLARGRFALSELLAAADLAVYLPSGAAALSGVAWAMAAGTPIMASAVPAIRELLRHGENAWLCRAGNLEQAARRMLRALEDRAQSQRQASLARSQAVGALGRSRMIEQCGRAYQNLLADRRIADGIKELVRFF